CGRVLSGLLTVWIRRRTLSDRRNSHHRVHAGLPSLRRTLAGTNLLFGAWRLGHHPDLLCAASNLYLSAGVHISVCPRPFFGDRFLPAPVSFATPHDLLGQLPRRLHPRPDTPSSVRGGGRL